MIQRKDAFQAIWEILSLTPLTRSVNIVMLEPVKKLMSNIFRAEWDGDDSLHCELLVISFHVPFEIFNLISIDSKFDVWKIRDYY